MYFSHTFMSFGSRLVYPGCALWSRAKKKKALQTVAGMEELYCSVNTIAVDSSNFHSMKSDIFYFQFITDNKSMTIFCWPIIFDFFFFSPKHFRCFFKHRMWSTSSFRLQTNLHQSNPYSNNSPSRRQMLQNFETPAIDRRASWMRSHYHIRLRVD